MIKYLNLGCGNRFSDDWVNLDFKRTGLSVQAHNLLEGIPFPDESFDVVYHSHMLEHFPKRDAFCFLRECFRVLKPSGIIRVVVPDLEQIALEYLKNLKGAKQGDQAAMLDYDWIMLELYDQTVRNVSGGEMVEYWKNPALGNELYVKNRIGDEFENFRRIILKNKKVSQRSFLTSWRTYFQFSRYKAKLLQSIMGILGVGSYIEVGKFRAEGEVHQWMYDEYSLGELLKKVGFVEVERRTAFESKIPLWEKYRFLDVVNGSPRKPDSLFMEAFK